MTSKYTSRYLVVELLHDNMSLARRVAEKNNPSIEIPLGRGEFLLNERGVL